MPCRLQIGQHSFVAVHALHLIERALVMVEAQPSHAFNDHVNRGLGRAVEVGVFNAQNKVTARGACKGPGVKGRANVAEVNKTSR